MFHLIPIATAVSFATAWLFLVRTVLKHPY